MKNIFKTKTLITILTLVAMLTLASIHFFASLPVTFKDVPASYWGYKTIQRAYNDGVVNGTDYNEATGVRNFSPEAKLTMAQFATILARAFYADDLAASTAGNDPWYAATQEVCEKNGVTEGSSFYNAEVESSRYQMASFMYNVLKDKGVKLPSDAEIAVAQSKIADWNIISVRDQKAVATVFAMGLITGKDDAGTFAGNDSVTRAEAATVYCRLADAIAAGGSDKAVSMPVVPKSKVLAETPKASVPETTVKQAENVVTEDKKVEESKAEPVDQKQRVFELVNIVRAQNDVYALSLDTALTEVAQIRAVECAKSFSHTRPDNTSCFTILKENSILYGYAEENIACGQKDAESVMETWMNSPGHRANILNDHVTKIGIGYTVVDGRAYWVQMFTD